MRYFAIFFGIFAAFLFGLATPVSKILLENFHEFQLAGLLYLGAAIGMLPAMFTKNNTHISTTKGQYTLQQLGKIIGAIVCGGLLGPVFLLFGLKAAHAASVAIWLNMELVATAVLGTVLFHDHLDRNDWIGVTFTLCAGIIMTISEGYSRWFSALLVTTACLCWGFDNHFTALIDSISPSRITFMKGIFAGTMNLLIGLFLHNALPPLPLLLMALALGACSYGLSILLYVISAQNLGATRSQILFSSAPFFGILLSILFLKETFILAHIASMACIALGICFSNRIRHEHSHIHEKILHTHLHEHDDGHHHHHVHQEIHRFRKHSHRHPHEAMSHSHAHYPDLHHRHDHYNTSSL